MNICLQYLNHSVYTAFLLTAFNRKFLSKISKKKFACTRFNSSQLNTIQRHSVFIGKMCCRVCMLSFKKKLLLSEAGCLQKQQGPSHFCLHSALRVNVYECSHGRCPDVVSSPRGGSLPVFCPIRLHGQCRLRLQCSSLCHHACPCWRYRLSKYRSVHFVPHPNCWALNP